MSKLTTLFGTDCPLTNGRVSGYWYIPPQLTKQLHGLRYCQEINTTIIFVFARMLVGVGQQLGG